MSHDHLMSLTGLLGVDLIPVDLEAPDKIRGALCHYNPVTARVSDLLTRPILSVSREAMTHPALPRPTMITLSRSDVSLNFDA
jgi:hypothetical protein